MKIDCEGCERKVKKSVQGMKGNQFPLINDRYIIWHCFYMIFVHTCINVNDYIVTYNTYICRSDECGVGAEEAQADGGGVR